ncbi:transposable element Tcb2 transposase [Trichonephila clavipes]|nr:transposable element Tcb2 transposase [Trichonephila clavipes]
METIRLLDDMSFNPACEGALSGFHNYPLRETLGPELSDFVANPLKKKLPFLNGLTGAIFQQDNARPHTARVAQDFLRHFRTLRWPARSPDLSPLVHVWVLLKRQMPSCHSVHDLKLAVQDLWAHLTEDNIRCLINTMLDRVTACIAVEGGPTRY